jgi:hypothetical protein
MKTFDHRSRQQRCISLPFWELCRGAPVYPGLESLFSVISVGLSRFSCYLDMFCKRSSRHLISFGRWPGKIKRTPLGQTPALRSMHVRIQVS